MAFFFLVAEVGSRIVRQTSSIINAIVWPILSARHFMQGIRAIFGWQIASVFCVTVLCKGSIETDAVWQPFYVLVTSPDWNSGNIKQSARKCLTIKHSPPNKFMLKQLVRNVAVLRSLCKNTQANVLTYCLCFESEVNYDVGW